MFIAFLSSHNIHVVHVNLTATLNHSLFNRYHPPLLWGKSGHIQTILFGSLGRFNVRPIRGERHSIILHDGSTVHYDVFEPHARRQTAVRKTEESSGDESDKDLTMLVCPGKIRLVDILTGTHPFLLNVRRS